MKYLFNLALILLLSIGSSLLGGVVFVDLYEWFIRPIFGGPEISYLQAVGIMIFATIFKIGLKGADTAEGDTIFHKISSPVGMVITYLVLWGVAYVWHLFI